MKSYTKEKDSELWDKQKSMGKKKFIINTTLPFICVMLFLAIAFYFFGTYINYLFKIPNYSFNQIILSLITYIMAIAFIGFKMSNSLWEKRKIKFEGITEIITEIHDSELKNFILKGEKVMAVKRYRTITGTGLRESIRYVNLIGIHYSFNKK